MALTRINVDKAHLPRWDFHGGYGCCVGGIMGGKVWVDSPRSEANWYVGGTCPVCAPERPVAPEQRE